MKNAIIDAKNVKTTDILPKHDLFFGSPFTDPMAGIPMGDGDTGSLFWLSEDTLHINLNKTDLWDMTTRESDVYCSGEEENLTCLRHGGELTVKFPCPAFEMLYQKRFEQRLSLKDATATLTSETAFSNVEARLFCSNEAHVSVLECAFTAQDASALTVQLSRWGSRNLWRWYSQGLGNMQAGLDGTEALVNGNRLHVRQSLNGTDFCLAAHVVLQEKAVSAVVNRHTAAMTLPADTAHRLTVYYCICTGDDTAAAQANCDAALDRAVAAGVASLYEKHVRDWAAYWNKSFVSIAEDYQENLYYLDLYYANCQLHGKYPPHFTCGLWGFYHDYIPWTYYFFYNMQHMFAPLDAAGHGELGRVYYDMRKNQLPIAEKAAEAIWQAKGAFYHDVTDFTGRCAEYDSSNATPGSQIAMAMWKHYRFSGDEMFLHNVALPVMTATADFYLSMLKKEGDGLYHLYNTSAYEANPRLKDSITDMVMIRALFGALLQVPGLPKDALYRDVLSHLPAWIEVPLDDGDLVDGVFGWGLAKGQKPIGNGMVLSTGFDENGKPKRKMHGNAALAEYGFPDVELSLLYPGGVAGLKDKGTQLFDDLCNQIRLHDKCGCMQWCMTSLYMARMGMAAELKDFVQACISQWVIYANGMNSENPREEALDLNKYYTPEEVHSHKKFRMRAYPFRHFDMEMLPILAAATNEALLQSYDGVLRICPATLPTDPVSFRLYAEGGFRVDASVTQEDCCVSVSSLRGEDFVITLPERFTQSMLTVSATAASCAFVWQGDLLSVTGLPQGQTLTITTGAALAAPAPAVPNAAEKVCGTSVLGSASLWTE